MTYASRFPDSFPPPFASAWGDDAFGLWADFSFPVSENGDSVRQRLRWIEPGRFWMGSPDDEPERLDSEGPQHEVTISRGFWLADTACTEALWMLMMGSNPRYFKSDPIKSVEEVSWHDVQAFLQRLQALLQGCVADLPSEAEWEYACRAGTDTPFNFWPNLTPQQVNYDGNYPYAGGKKGEYRKKAVPVKSLLANRWGLYNMHGNVREWCKDGERIYNGQAQVDPLGPLTGEDLPRVVRGGWRDNLPWWVRSADRIAIPPGDASNGLGFRVCLRSIGSSQSTGRASGPSPCAKEA